MSDTPSSSGMISALLQEERRFPPPPALAATANGKADLYERAAKDPLAFWAEMAGGIDWATPFTKVLDWNVPWAKWFVGGTLNASVSCVDRHALGARRNKAALIWEGEPHVAGNLGGETRVLTYGDLYREVNRAAHAIRALGIEKGDRVAIYMPMVPEAAIAMLACARLGAAHTVIFGGFAPEAIRDRVNDSGAKLVITADGGYRRGNVIPLYDNVAKAVEGTPGVTHVLVLRRVGESVRPVTLTPGRDVWWHDALDAAPPTPLEPVMVDAEHPLYILYTSGTTGKPKGMLHTTGGYLVGTMASAKYVFDLKDDDVFWCTADVGWVTGHSYLVYGPLANGATCVMYEGAPDWPDKDRFWQIIAKYRVSILYTAPTAIRSFMRFGTDYPKRHDMSALRLLGTVGEPINPEAWIWYHENIGGGRCPIVDTWWQTETGMILITPLPGVTTTRPGSATFAFPGIDADVVDESGQSVPLGSGGYLVLRRPWPAMARTLWGDDERFQQTYWSRFPGLYFTGDGARRDEDGYIWLLGRVDDVLNVAGHRIGTMEVESALVSHPSVAEAAVIGVAHEIKGQALAAFVTPRFGITPDDALADTLKKHVATTIGAIARPDQIYFTAELPKTRSAKIMRRLLRDIAEGRVLGDTTTLTDPAVVADIRERYDHSEA
ncbi:MAG: acetate--CoA ligase [Chloroflexota bacterium]|nr:MAG: acetate--CoA ligase [Chloroflexota bacterium]